MRSQRRDAECYLRGLSESAPSVWFAISIFQKFARARSSTEQEVCSLRILAKDNLETFARELKGSVEACTMEFLTILLVFEGDGEAQDLVASGKSFSAYLEDGEDEAAVEDDDSLPLHSALQVFRKTFTEALVGAEVVDSDEEQPFAPIQGDERSELKSKIYQTVISKRKEMQKFYPLRNWDKKPWADAGEALGIFQKSKFAANGAAEAGKQNKLMLFIPELFQSMDTFLSATSFKDNVCWRADMGEVFRWMLANRDDNTIVAAADARSP